MYMFIFMYKEFYANINGNCLFTFGKYSNDTKNILVIFINSLPKKDFKTKKFTSLF